MKLSPYLETVREGLMAAVAAGGEAAQQLGGQLAAAVEPATRLALMEALAAAADEITAALEDSTVEVHLRGREPVIVVNHVGPVPPPPPPPPPPGAEADAGTSRVTLRLPENLKTQVENAAAQQNVSVNSWLVNAVSQALNQPPPGRRHGLGQRISGYVSG